MVRFGCGGGAGSNARGLHTFCRVRVTIPGKYCQALPFHRAAEYALGVEDLSKPEAEVGSLSFQNPVLEIPSILERSMSEPAVVTPAALAIARPEPGEYAPYYERYISLVAGSDILGALDAQRRQTMMLLSGRSEADGNFRYAPEKWNAKEVMGHVCDTERIFAYRALRIARGDQTPLAGFEQDDYVKHGPFAAAPMAEIIEDYIAVRRATLTLLRNLDEAAWGQRGVASKNEVSVRALAYMIAGHELHHRGILEEKYFPGR